MPNSSHPYSRFTGLQIPPVPATPFPDIWPVERSFWFLHIFAPVCGKSRVCFPPLWMSPPLRTSFSTKIVSPVYTSTRAGALSAPKPSTHTCVSWNAGSNLFTFSTELSTFLSKTPLAGRPKPPRQSIDRPVGPAATPCGAGPNPLIRCAWMIRRPTCLRGDAQTISSYPRSHPARGDRAANQTAEAAAQYFTRWAIYSFT